MIYKKITALIFFRGVSAILFLISNVIIANYYPSGAVGSYFLLYSLMIVLSVLSRRGLDTWLYRYISQTKNHNGYVYEDCIRIFLEILGNGLKLYIIVILISYLFTSNNLSTAVMENYMVLLVSIVSFSALATIAEVLKALGYPVVSSVVNGIFYPLSFILLLIFDIFVVKVFDVLFFHVFTVFINAIFAVLILIYINKKKWLFELTEIKTLRFSIGSIYKDSFEYWVNTFTQRSIIPWMPVICLGIFSSDVVIGYFSVTLRLSSLVSFFSAALASSLFPLLLKAGKNAVSASKYCLVVVFLSLLPQYLLVLMFAEEILLVYGPEYTKYGFLLITLASSQLFFGISHVFQYMLIFTDHKKTLFNSALIISCLLACLFALAVWCKSMEVLAFGLLISSIVYVCYLSVCFYSERKSEN